MTLERIRQMIKEMTDYLGIDADPVQRHILEDIVLAYISTYYGKE